MGAIFISTKRAISKSLSQCLDGMKLIIFNRLIEEFMLLANMAVAQCISKKYPDISLLRRHPPPKAKALENLVSYILSCYVHVMYM